MKKLPKLLQDEIRLALEQGALEIQNRAKQLAPYKTGNLRRSITHDPVSGSNGFAQAIGTSVVYAAIHEFGGNAGRGGRTRIKPYRDQGYFRPAIKEATPIIKTYFERNIERGLKSIQ